MAQRPMTNLVSLQLETNWPHSRGMAGPTVGVGEMDGTGSRPWPYFSFACFSALLELHHSKNESLKNTDLLHYFVGKTPLPAILLGGMGYTNP